MIAADQYRTKEEERALGVGIALLDIYWWCDLEVAIVARLGNPVRSMPTKMTSSYSVAALGSHSLILADIVKAMDKATSAPMAQYRREMEKQEMWARRYLPNQKSCVDKGSIKEPELIESHKYTLDWN